MAENWTGGKHVIEICRTRSAMLTPDQVQLRLARAASADQCDGCVMLWALLHEILPDLVASIRLLQQSESQESDSDG